MKNKKMNDLIHLNQRIKILKIVQILIMKKKNYLNKNPKDAITNNI